MGALAASIAILALAPSASGETTHTYPVTLTISVDRGAGKISGTIVTDAPSEFCDSSTVRVERRCADMTESWRGSSPKRGNGE